MHEMRLSQHCHNTLQEVRANHYIYGQDGRVQQFAFIPDIPEESIDVLDEEVSSTQPYRT